MMAVKNPIEKHFSTLSRYHYFVFALIFLSKIPIFWHVLSLIFLSPPIDYNCNVTRNSTGFKNLCPCGVPQWDRSVFTETMQTKFEIFCNSNWMISFSQSISYTGLLIGSFIFGFLSDKYGRLSMFALCCLILALCGCLITVMPNAASFTFMRCIEGIGVGGAIVTSYVLCVEYCGLRYREIITAFYHIAVNISHMTLPGISYLLRDCDDFQLAISIPVFMFVGLKWILMESPKWLMDSGHVKDAVRNMMKYGQLSHTQSCGNIREEIERYHAAHASKKQRNIKFWHIFRHKKLVFNLMCMSYIYFICGMGYYGVTQFIGKMSGNIHKNVAISGALLLPGTIAGIFLLKTLNRRTFLMSTVFLSGLFIIITISIPANLVWGRVVVACICNCFFFLSFIIVFLYGVELFPTSIRNSVLGFLSVLSRVGQILSPMVNSVPENISGLIYGALALIGTGLCYLLPETKNSELPSTLDDSKTLGRQRVTEIPLDVNESVELA